MKCLDCKGIGYFQYAEEQENCNTCNGTGEVESIKAEIIFRDEECKKYESRFIVKQITLEELQQEFEKNNELICLIKRYGSKTLYQEMQTQLKFDGYVQAYEDLDLIKE